MKKYLEKFIGQAVAILCVRYWYRGIVAEVCEDYVILSTPYGILDSEPVLSAKKNSKEELIPSDLCISLGAIEQICQPAWVWNDYKKGE